MGGQSKGGTTTISNTTKTIKPTSQTNPYFSTTTDKKGNTVTKFNEGTASEKAFNFVNNNISGLLNNYLNPSLNDPTTQAKLQQFNKTQQQNLQNNIISPLAQNNMLRSSQATNMYNNLSNQAADYSKELIANSHDDTWNMINNLLSLYSSAYNGTANEESMGINASIGSGNTSGMSVSN